MQPLIASLAGGSKMGGLLGMGLQLLGKPATLDNQPATAFDVVLADGTLRIGGLKLATVPPLF